MGATVNLKQDRALQSREKLLRAAILLFSQHGFEATGLRMVAQHAGTSFQVIAYHFGTKEDLWRAAVDRLWEDAYANLSRAVIPMSAEAGEDPKRLFRHHVRNLLAWNARYPHLRRISTQEFLAQSERYTNVILPHLREFMRHSRSLITDLTNAGLVKDLSAEEIQVLYRGLMVCNSIAPDEQELLTGKPCDDDESLDWQTDLLMKIFFRDQAPAFV